MVDSLCRQCMKQTVVVLDHTAGDTICSECGLVLEVHPVELMSEWPTFADDASDKDPFHVDGPRTPLLEDTGLSTLISKPTTGGSGTSPLPNLCIRASNPKRHVVHAFKSIDTMSHRLGLATTIKDRANEIYNKVENYKPLKGRNQSVIFAACLYIACRHEHKPRTVKEIFSVVNGAKKKEFGRVKQLIVRHLQTEMGQSMAMGAVHAVDYVRRFCSNLGMTSQAAKAAQETVQKSDELDIRRSPTSVAATVVYIITLLSDKKSLKEISVVTRVAEGTIKNVFRELCPKLLRLVPSWFASEEAIKTLQP